MPRDEILQTNSTIPFRFLVTAKESAFSKDPFTLLARNCSLIAGNVNVNDTWIKFKSLCDGGAKIYSDGNDARLPPHLVIDCIEDVLKSICKHSHKFFTDWNMGEQALLILGCIIACCTLFCGYKMCCAPYVKPCYDPDAVPKTSYKPL